MNEIFSVHYKIMAMTMVRNEEGKERERQGAERNSCSSKAAGMIITAAEATTQTGFNYSEVGSPVCISSDF